MVCYIFFYLSYFSDGYCAAVQPRLKLSHHTVFVHIIFPVLLQLLLELKIKMETVPVINTAFVLPCKDNLIPNVLVYLSAVFIYHIRNLVKAILDKLAVFYMPKLFSDSC